MSWLNEHASALTALTNFGLLVVWILYAHLFYRDYRRRRRPRIIIDQMSGHGHEATCVITNMSSEWLYIEAVFSTGRTVDDELTARITEYRPVSSVEQPDIEIEALTRQGPLAPGDFLAVGTLYDLAERAVARASEPGLSIDALESVEVRVVAKVSSEDDPIGAYRHFRVDQVAGGHRFWPAERGTRHLLSRSERQAVRRWLHDEFNVA